MIGIHATLLCEILRWNAVEFIAIFLSLVLTKYWVLVWVTKDYLLCFKISIMHHATLHYLSKMECAQNQTINFTLMISVSLECFDVFFGIRFNGNQLILDKKVDCGSDAIIASVNARSSILLIYLSPETRYSVWSISRRFA